MKKGRIHILIGAALFAALLWVIVNMRDQYQATIVVPLVLEDIPSGKAIQTPVPRRLFLRCSSDGWRLAAMTLKGDVRCVLDVNSLPTNQPALTLKDITERLNLPYGIQPITMRPESLFITLDKSAQKKIPVTLDYQLSFKDGYGLVGSPVVTPESVQVEGAETVLKTISTWKTAYTRFENLKASVETDVMLAGTSAYTLRFLPAQVRVRVNVQPFAEKPFSGLAVEVLSVPVSREVILIPPKIDVVVRGGIEQLAGLSLRDFRASVDYSVLVSDASGFIDPQVVSPAGVQLVSKRPERLQYIVRKRL